MLNNFILKISFRYFSAKKNERLVSFISLMSLIGMTLGVAALIVVMSVMNGFRIELTKNIVGLNGDINISSKKIEIDDFLTNKISNYEFVTNATQLVMGQALAVAKNTSGVIIRGIDISAIKNKRQIYDNIAGNFSNYKGSVIAIGYELATTLQVTIGSKIRLITPQTVSTFLGAIPRAKDFTVVAIFSSGLYDYDAVNVLMPSSEAKNFLSTKANLIEVNINDRDMLNEYVEKIRNDIDDIDVKSWILDNKQFLNALEIERNAMFLILSLIIIVATFNIVSSLFMLVKDKTKDIAILRTIGCSRLQIMLIFIINGLIIGVIGTSLGVIGGLLISNNIDNIRKFLETMSGATIFNPAIYFLYRLPSSVNLQDVILVSFIAITTSLLATLYPAYKAASLNPVDALRYE